MSAAVSVSGLPQDSDAIARSEVELDEHDEQKIDAERKQSRRWHV